MVQVRGFQGHSGSHPDKATEPILRELFQIAAWTRPSCRRPTYRHLRFPVQVTGHPGTTLESPLLSPCGTTKRRTKHRAYLGGSKQEATTVGLVLRGGTSEPSHGKTCSVGRAVSVRSPLFFFLFRTSPSCPPRSLSTIPQIPQKQ